MNMNGSVKWFAPKKGYGFIIVRDGKDYFCHYTEIQATGFKNLNPRDEVSFDVKETPRGFVATNVVVTKEAPFEKPKYEH